MNKATIAEKKETTAIQPADDPTKIVTPALVEAEPMFEKLTEITTETARRAFELFGLRGGEMGREIEDWFKAESEMLRPVPVEITETKDSIFVKAAVAGFKPDDIEISVRDNAIIISGEAKKSLDTGNDKSTVIREWTSNRFFRKLTLPAHVDADKVTAKLTHGMLEVTLAKAVMEEATKVNVAGA